MALYTVLEPPDGQRSRILFVKDGFAGWAVVLTVFWALWHRMWIVAAVLLAILAAINVSANLGLVSESFAGVLQLAVGVVFGFEARDLLILARQRSGYRNAGLIAASNLQAAEFAYFSDRPVPAAPVATTAFRPASDDMLNLFGNV